MSVLNRDIFSGRVKRLRERIAQSGVGCAVVYSDIWRTNNVAYLTDYRQGGGGVGQSWTALLLPLNGTPTIFTGFEETGCAKLQLKIEANIEPSTRFEEVLIAHFAKHPPVKLGLVGTPIILHSVYRAIERCAKKTEIVDCDLMLCRERWVKLPEEIEAIKRAFVINDTALNEVIAAVHDGVTEHALFSIGTSSIARQGGELAFIPTVNIGVNSGVAMKRPSDMMLQRGDLAMLDFGTMYEGYTADTTLCIAYHVTDSFKRGILETALEAREAGLALVKPGTFMKDVENAVRGVIKKRGYGEYILHNFGHGLGIDSSEEDLPIGPHSELVIEKNMVFTFEPGIYVPGVGGCRLEECMVITDNGFEILSKLRPDYFID